MTKTAGEGDSLPSLTFLMLSRTDFLMAVSTHLRHLSLPRKSWGWSAISTTRLWQWGEGGWDLNCWSSSTYSSRNRAYLSSERGRPSLSSPSLRSLSQLLNSSHLSLLVHTSPRLPTSSSSPRSALSDKERGREAGGLWREGAGAAGDDDDNVGDAVLVVVVTATEVLHVLPIQPCNAVMNISYQVTTIQTSNSDCWASSPFLSFSIPTLEDQTSSEPTLMLISFILVDFSWWTSTNLYRPHSVVWGSDWNCFLIIMIISLYQP